jgi:acylphosphatase
MRERAHVYISGHVQGVFFRYETKRNAENLGLTGWVRNLPDGSVECVFKGEKENIEKMLKFCEIGPPGAKVTDVKINWENCKDEFDNFQIRY